ncbi:LacI family DNA-binding transcriptional regulator [Georgenia thermotolerans]|uniref:Substrate-binding domain-containing protein n=1 Tax=Georgenia thermotolerans TaxID=527326 RepID=A0A7J5UN45_9MICO|nr:LacI family DNA-binding transcriptional regulator [Georgenia thermotolerans]KAE8763343.1 substrate-binding domain-containing protein [Georgenia thermotolerans]
MSATIRDVAAAAGVSVATVSRVTTASGYPVGAETRARVLAAIEELNYRPNALASGLNQKNSRLVGVVAPDLANAYYPEVTRGIEDVANEHGYQVLFCSTDRDRGKAAAYIDALLQKRVAGLAVVGGGPEVNLQPRDVAGYGASVVYIGRPSEKFSTVRAENGRAAAAMTQHLLDLGHTDIAFVSGADSSAATVERLRGYRRALKDNGLAARPERVLAGDYTEAGGYAAARALMEREDRPTALFAANDRMAIGAMAAMADLGLRVPEDVAVVGFDDVPMASYVRPALTSVSISARQLGVEAMRLLLAGPDARPRHVRVKTRLVVRASCGAHAPQRATTASHP